MLDIRPRIWLVRIRPYPDAMNLPLTYPSYTFHFPRDDRVASSACQIDNNALPSAPSPIKQVQRLSDQQGILRAEASITIQRLGRAETDLETAGAALQGERFLRERGESTAEGLKRELSERKEDCENLRREAAAEREARRRSESQVGYKVTGRAREDVRCHLSPRGKSMRLPEIAAHVRIHTTLISVVTIPASNRFLRRKF